jgi:hypothetical protein
MARKRELPATTGSSAQRNLTRTKYFLPWANNLNQKLWQSFYELAEYQDIATLQFRKITFLKYCSNLIIKNLLKTLPEFYK